MSSPRVGVSASCPFSVAEYCCPVLAHSSHTDLIDVQLNSSMPIITRTLRFAPLPWLPVLSDIKPLLLRRRTAVDKLITRRQTCVLNVHYITMCFFSSAKLPAITQAPLDRHSPNKRQLPVAKWMEVNSGDQFLSIG